jgi:hypothetical protein
MSPRRRTRYDRLAQSVRRLSAEVRRAQANRPAASPPTRHRPQPHTDWEQQTEGRLRAIEQQLANQNRLLLVAILTLAGDIALGLTR